MDLIKLIPAYLNICSVISLAECAVVLDGCVCVCGV